MKDDFSELINNASCYYISSENSLYAFRNSLRYRYAKLGAKWYLAEVSNYNIINSGYNCRSYDDIVNINSNVAFEPIFVFIALICVIFTYWLWFNVFKRITKWKL